MKIAPLYHELKKRNDIFQTLIVHTGQHYDYNMSDSFFRDLKIPKPDYFLSVGSGSHAEQTSKCIASFETVLLKETPDVVVVVGDVNSTMACALVASKITYPFRNRQYSTFVQKHHRPLIVHVEAGLRSHDRTMPEEINRLVTDALSDLLLIPSADAKPSLLKEGIAAKKIKMVGNVMIDSLEFIKPKTNSNKLLHKLGIMKNGYGLATLHRPSNVDDKDKLRQLIETIMLISDRIKIVFAVHPRTKKQLVAYNIYPLLEKNSNVVLTEPVGYLDFMSLLRSCKFVLTDSGGVQEETTYLNVPCLTLRENTERPITIKKGTNKLIRIEELSKAVNQILVGRWKQSSPIAGWDGKAATRIVSELIRAAAS